MRAQICRTDFWRTIEYYETLYGTTHATEKNEYGTIVYPFDDKEYTLGVIYPNGNDRDKHYLILENLMNNYRSYGGI